MVLYSRDRLITNQSVFLEALLRCSAEQGSVGDSRKEPLPPPLPRRLLSSLGEKWVCKEKLEGMGDQGRNGGRQCVWTWETEEGYETAPNSNRRARSSTCLHRGHWAGFEGSSLLWVLLAVHSSCEPLIVGTAVRPAPHLFLPPPQPSSALPAHFSQRDLSEWIIMNNEPWF